MTGRELDVAFDHGRVVLAEMIPDRVTWIGSTVSLAEERCLVRAVYRDRIRRGEDRRTARSVTRRVITLAGNVAHLDRLTSPRRAS